MRSTFLRGCPQIVSSFMKWLELQSPREDRVGGERERKKKRERERKRERRKRES